VSIANIYHIKVIFYNFFFDISKVDFLLQGFTDGWERNHLSIHVNIFLVLNDNINVSINDTVGQPTHQKLYMVLVIAEQNTWHLTIEGHGIVIDLHRVGGTTSIHSTESRQLVNRS